MQRFSLRVSFIRSGVTLSAGHKHLIILCHVCVRLLAQLRDMEEAFDGFFEKHHLKLQQYLQLLQYEISFQKV